MGFAWWSAMARPDHWATGGSGICAPPADHPGGANGVALELTHLLLADMFEARSTGWTCRAATEKVYQHQYGINTAVRDSGAIGSRRER
jgi:hypothetical protein